MPLPHLLVDGYNVLHAWPLLRKAIPRGLDAAAGLLVERLRVLHDFGGVFVTVVFDGRGERVQAGPAGRPPDLEVLYAPAGLSADAVIEQVVCRAPDPTNFIVATRDNMVRETIHALGARPLTPEDLAEWVEKTERQQTQALQQRSRRDSRDFGNRLF